MVNMKDDMAGAARRARASSPRCAELKPRVNVHGIFAASENMPGGARLQARRRAARLNGKTVEITNTDAEGRLVLGDVLDLCVARSKPAVIIDLATLTGACVVALGPDIVRRSSPPATSSQTGMLSGREAQGEKFWRMPLENEYMEKIKSDVADMKNSGGRWGGAITRGALPPRVRRRGMPWAHLDIAGPALVESDRPYRPAGGTGVMVRTLLRYLEEQ